MVVSVMTTESLTEVLNAHLRSRGLALTATDGTPLSATDASFAARELAIVSKDAVLSTDEPTVVMSADMLANVLALDKMLGEADAKKAA